MRVVLRRERDAAEDLQRPVRDVERRARRPCLGDRRGAEAVGLSLVERGGRVEDARPRALRRGRPCPRACAARPGSSRSCDRTDAAPPRSRARARGRLPPRPTASAAARTAAVAATLVDERRRRLVREHVLGRGAVEPDGGRPRATGRASARARARRRARRGGRARGRRRPSCPPARASRAAASASTTDVFVPDTRVALERRRGVGGSEAALGLGEAERSGTRRRVASSSGPRRGAARPYRRAGRRRAARRAPGRRARGRPRRAQPRTGRSRARRIRRARARAGRPTLRATTPSSPDLPSRSARGRSRRASPVRLSAGAPCQSWGRARIRSAMIERWICRVPPYTDAARE